jgi:O-acetyl-ADP-ribose deacetylase (regulator of RNase III)
MITYRQTNLFDSEAQTLVNTVNCVGVMGKGIAKEFKARDNEMFSAYREVCARKLLKPGMLWLWSRSSPWVLNFPTKNHWRGASKIEWVELGLQKFVSTYKDKGISSISFPKLGCGNGGLDWQDVKPIMECYLSAVDIDVFIHDYDSSSGLPEHVLPEKEQQLPPSSFEEFFASIKKIARKIKDESSTSSDQHSYAISISEIDQIIVEHDGKKSTVELDDLRGVWLSLQRSTLTKKEAEWFDSELRGSLLDILARLPYTRSLTVRRGDEKELAVELVRGTSDHTNATDQESMI